MDEKLKKYIEGEGNLYKVMEALYRHSVASLDYVYSHFDRSIKDLGFYKSDEDDIICTRDATKKNNIGARKHSERKNLGKSIVAGGKVILFSLLKQWNNANKNTNNRSIGKEL